MRRQPNHDHERGQRLEEDREASDPAQDPSDVAEVERTRFRLREQPRLQPEPPDDDESEHGGKRHDPEAADLDQSEYHDLAEVAPVDGGVDDDEAGDADGGRRGERRGEERGGPRAGSRDREREQTGSDQDPDGEGDDDQPGGMVESEGLKHASTAGSTARQSG